MMSIASSFLREFAAAKSKLTDRKFVLYRYRNARSVRTEDGRRLIVHFHNGQDALSCICDNSISAWKCARERIQVREATEKLGELPKG